MARRVPRTGAFRSVMAAGAFACLLVTTFSEPATGASLPRITVVIPLPSATGISTVFNFHPSANPTAIRIEASAITLEATACAYQGSWGHFWTGCVPIPPGGTMLPADDGSSHVGVLVLVHAPRSVKAQLNVSYVPEDYHFSLDHLSPRPGTASILLTSGKPVLLGVGVAPSCGGRLTVSYGSRIILRRSVFPSVRGFGVNELAKPSRLIRVSLWKPRCTTDDPNVGLGVFTGSIGGP